MNTSKPNPHTITQPPSWNLNLMNLHLTANLANPPVVLAPGISTFTQKPGMFIAIPIKLPAKQHCFIIRSVTVRFVVESVVCR